MLILLTTAVLAQGYNAEIEHTKTVTWQPLMLASGALAVSIEYRVSANASLLWEGGPYTYAGAVGAMSVMQARGYWLGDFDRGLYSGGHLGGSLLADADYWYYGAVLAGIAGGKWTYKSGLTLDQHWGVGINLVGMAAFGGFGVGWSW